MSSFRVLVVATAAAVLAGCGFQPLYGRANEKKVIDAFASVQVAPISDWIGVQLKNELDLLLHPRGDVRKPRYRLATTLSESSSSLAVQKSAVATRSNLKVMAQYRLLHLRSGRSVAGWSDSVTVSYNIFDSEFATLMAEKDARKRATLALAADASSRLAARFSLGLPGAGGQ